MLAGTCTVEGFGFLCEVTKVAVRVLERFQALQGL